MFLFAIQQLKSIEDIEKQLPAKRKAFLLALRSNDWKVVAISCEEADWAFDEKWIIESTRQRKGFSLQLWFFKYNGEFDGMDRVVVTSAKAEQPNSYGATEPSVEFDGLKFEQQLTAFINAIHNLRISDISSI